MTVGAAARHLALLAFLVAAGFVCSLALAQSAAPVPARPSYAAGLPRQIWAVAYDPAAAARVQRSKLARLRARGINVAVAMHLTKRQHTRLRKLNARSLLLLTPRRRPVCRGPKAATCIVEAASIKSATRLRGRRGVDLVVVTVSGPAALRRYPCADAAFWRSSSSGVDASTRACGPARSSVQQPVRRSTWASLRSAPQERKHSAPTSRSLRTYAPVETRRRCRRCLRLRHRRRPAAARRC